MFNVKINQSATLPIPCPKCGHKQNELVSRLRSNPQVTCASCGQVTAIDGNQLDAFVKTLESFGR